MISRVERHSEEAERTVRDIRRATRHQYSAAEKVRIVIAGLRGEDSIAELCRREGINQNLYYRWSKDFLEAGKPGESSKSRIRWRRRAVHLNSHAPSRDDGDRVTTTRRGIRRAGRESLKSSILRVPWIRAKARTRADFDRFSKNVEESRTCWRMTQSNTNWSPSTRQPVDELGDGGRRTSAPCPPTWRHHHGFDECGARSDVVGWRVGPALGAA
jgi:transposase-like protein